MVVFIAPKIFVSLLFSSPLVILFSFSISLLTQTLVSFFLSPDLMLGLTKKVPGNINSVRHSERVGEKGRDKERKKGGEAEEKE